MRTGAACGHRGYYHETAFYRSDDELRAIVVPFALDGLAAGEPTVLAFGPHNTDVVGRALGDRPGLTVLIADLQYARPAVTIRTYRELFATLVAEGATQIRVVGDVPHPGTGASWDAWVRYEAIVNEAFDEFPIWGLCPYDLRVTPDDVIADVVRTHPHIATVDGGHHRNDRFEEPHGFLRSRPQPGTDPVELTPADETLVDPSPTAVRRAAQAAARSAGLATDDAEGLVLSLSELAANAARHGRPPVTARLWGAPGRVTATITDTGPGPADPAVGLLPTRGELGLGGRGLWIAHQLCRDVALRRDDDGFTVRLTAGAPTPQLTAS